jgi:hypothetical protein
MARFATLWDSDMMKVHTWNNPTIDAGRNLTAITGAFNSLLFYDRLERIDLKDNKTVLWYESGFCLVVRR